MTEKVVEPFSYDLLMMVVEIKSIFPIDVYKRVALLDEVKAGIKVKEKNPCTMDSN